jgi:hypothetical protein
MMALLPDFPTPPIEPTPSLIGWWCVYAEDDTPPFTVAYRVVTVIDSTRVLIDAPHHRRPGTPFVYDLEALVSHRGRWLPPGVTVDQIRALVTQCDDYFDALWEAKQRRKEEAEAAAVAAK